MQESLNGYYITSTYRKNLTREKEDNLGKVGKSRYRNVTKTKMLKFLLSVVQTVRVPN